MNSKVEYLGLTLLFNILFLLLVFIGFNTCKVRFGISYTITIIIVQAIVNTLDDCDLLEKVVNMTNVHEHNDVTVSIKYKNSELFLFFFLSTSYHLKLWHLVPQTLLYWVPCISKGLKVLYMKVWENSKKLWKTCTPTVFLFFFRTCIMYYRAQLSILIKALCCLIL